MRRPMLMRSHKLRNDCQTGIVFVGYNQILDWGHYGFEAFSLQTPLFMIKHVIPM
eukprot:m.336982 g.336982  ORF g.336982 m.336982 type:complete len:55 (+) comp18010_c0_seq1:591-755(+)